MCCRIRSCFSRRHPHVVCLCGMISMGWVISAPTICVPHTTQRVPVASPYRPSRQPQAHQRDSLQRVRSEEHTSELQSLMRISYAVFCLTKKKSTMKNHTSRD